MSSYTDSQVAVMTVVKGIMDTLMCKRYVERRTRDVLYGASADEEIFAYHDGIVDGLAMAIDIINEEYERVLSEAEE